MASSESVKSDKYRSHIYGEGEKNTVWRFGSPPNYDVVNKLFEEGRTQEWADGTLEGRVQRLLKTWEMEVFHKVRVQDFKTINHKKYTFSLNGRAPKRLEDILKVGGYNVLLQTCMPENLRGYNPAVETSQSSLLAFTTTFPRGFAIEIVQVYSGPPVILFKFRHWAYMEGPFKGHAPTGELVEFYGICILTVDDSMRIEKVELFYDPGDVIGALLKGPSLEGTPASSSGCPFLNKS